MYDHESDNVFVADMLETFEVDQSEGNWLGILNVVGSLLLAGEIAALSGVVCAPLKEKIRAALKARELEELMCGYTLAGKLAWFMAELKGGDLWGSLEALKELDHWVIIREGAKWLGVEEELLEVFPEYKNLEMLKRYRKNIKNFVGPMEREERTGWMLEAERPKLWWWLV
jgi:hypothetical protein